MDIMILIAIGFIILAVTIELIQKFCHWLDRRVNTIVESHTRGVYDRLEWHGRRIGEVADVVARLTAPVVPVEAPSVACTSEGGK